MKKILVVGGYGQLGQCLQKISQNRETDFKFAFKSSLELDITNEDEVLEIVSDFRPDFIVNAAAYTQVDLAEKEVQEAYQINAHGVENLAIASKKYGSILIHISTDYVFDGESEISYDEDNFTAPQGVYGMSKLKGEELALEANPRTIVVRTSWLYSEFKKNFVKTMLTLFDSRKEVSVVADQYGQPTNANDLAQAIIDIIEKEPKVYGVFHFANYPETTWFEFASKIKEIANSKVILNPIPTSQYPTPAKRPRRSTMGLDKIEKFYGIEPRNWEDSLEECVSDILNKGHE